MWFWYVFGYTVMTGATAAVLFCTPLRQPSGYSVEESMKYSVILGLAWPITAPMLLVAYIIGKVRRACDE